jgi:molybdopterin-guanine dinucleotide biosynthesis protein MobB
MQAVAVVGTKKSGKTTTIENLTRELTKRGYKVACIKHINEDFAFDTPGKDTWRYQQAGANTIIATGQDQTVTIQKTTTLAPLSALLEKCEGNDITFIEGFKKTVAQNPAIPKIAVTKNQTEAEKAMETYKPIIAFSGPYNTTTLNPNIPYANAQTNPKELSDIIENILKKHAIQG